jgi:hypothetical protein
MNIFVLDNDPETAAQMMCDKHIPKMIVETYQMLGSALRRHGATDDQMPLTQAGKPLKGGYHHHPCTKWVGDNICNFAWTWWHGIELCNEYTFRYGKVHSCERGIRHIGQMFDMIPNGPQTPYAQAMPDEYKSANAIDSYRRYYIMDKSRFAKWEKGREAPYWWTTEECDATLCETI